MVYLRFLSLGFMLIILLCGSRAKSLEPLHVDGRYLKNPKGDIVTLHGWITNWQNLYQEFYQETVDYFINGKKVELK